MPDDKMTISIITTSWYAPEKEIESAAEFFKESGFDVRVKTRGIDKKNEPEEFNKYDLPTVFKKIKKQYFESELSSQPRPHTEEEEERIQKAFEQDYLDYSDAFVKMKKQDGTSLDVEDERLQTLGEEEFAPLKDYLEDSYQKSQILQEEVEAASRGEVDVIWPVDGGSGAPEMLRFLPEKLPENPAVIVGMSDVTAVQNALIQSTNYTMRGVQEFGSRVFGYDDFTSENKERFETLYSTIEKARNGESIDNEFKLTASNKNKEPTEPQLVNLSGGTLNVIDRASGSPWQLSQDRNSDTVIVEMHGQAKSVAGSISQKTDGQEPDAFEKIFADKKNIFVGNVLFDKESKEYQQFTDRAAEEGINIYEGLPFGHGGPNLPREAVPLNVPSVLLPGESEGEATLLINPSKELLQQKLEEIGYKTNPAKFVETLKTSPEQAGEFIKSEPDVAALMIKYSGLEPEDVFQQARVETSVQQQITEKIGQGAKEPSNKKVPATPIKFPDRLAKKKEEPETAIVKKTQQELEAMPSEEKRTLAEISQGLKNRGMESKKEEEKDDDSVTSKSSHAPKYLEEKEQKQKSGFSNTLN